MSFCPNCGKAGVERLKFCPECGQGLTLGLAAKPGYVAEPEAPIREMNWFERHLNWTMVLTWAGTYVVVLIAAVFVVLTDPSVSEEALNAMGLVITLIIYIAVGQWVLRKKNRSLAWLLICWTWFFLLIENRSGTKDGKVRTTVSSDRATELMPDSADACCERGDSYCEMGEYAKAVADYTRAIGLDPSYASGYFRRAYAYGEMAECDRAIADYTKAIELDPGDAYAYYNRGLEHQHKGEVLRAVSDLERCIELTANSELRHDAEQALCEMKISAGRVE